MNALATIATQQPRAKFRRKGSAITYISLKITKFVISDEANTITSNTQKDVLRNNFLFLYLTRIIFANNNAKIIVIIAPPVQSVWSFITLYEVVLNRKAIRYNAQVSADALRTNPIKQRSSLFFHPALNNTEKRSIRRYI
ncbi:MAG TPA: hypothetical protein DEP65_07475 [Ruminococcus sp.]|nr:hypothetical protein [Ruminococcus sp.]